jgi:hypothetical protein
MTGRKSTLIGTLAALNVLAATIPVLANASAEDAAASLQKQGYHHIQFDPNYKPGYQAYACREQAHYRIRMDGDAKVTDTEQVGACSRETGPQETRVQAPFTDVQVGEDGVRVRAPFVDLNIR